MGDAAFAGFSAPGAARRTRYRMIKPMDTDSQASSFEISGRPVGGGAPTYVIAEVAQAHDGSLGTAHAFIDAAADAGADAVILQMLNPLATSPFGWPSVSRTKPGSTIGGAWSLAPNNGPGLPTMHDGPDCIS